MARSSCSAASSGNCRDREANAANRSGRPAVNSASFSFCTRTISAARSDFQHARGVKEVGLAAQPVPLGQRPQSTSSNDNGDVTWNVPTGLMTFPASVPGILYHHWAAAVTPTSSVAHKGMVVGVKVLAASVLDLMTSPELRAEAKKQFDSDTQDTKYFTLLPPEAKPSPDLNRAMMEQFRPAMAKFYLN
jgi:aminobenzoyl-glutamate utilization protein B